MMVFCEGFETRETIHHQGLVCRPVVVLLIRLAFTPALRADFGPNLSLIVPKLIPTSWGEPLSWHSFFGHSFRISKPVEMQ